MKPLGGTPSCQKVLQVKHSLSKTSTRPLPPLSSVAPPRKTSSPERRVTRDCDMNKVFAWREPRDSAGGVRRLWSGGQSQDWRESCECSREWHGAMGDVSVVQRWRVGDMCAATRCKSPTLHPLQDGAYCTHPHPTSDSFSACVCIGVLGGGEQQQYAAAVH
jgi:hypothetical protein